MNFINNEINGGKISIFFDNNNCPFKAIIYNIGKVDLFDENTISFGQIKINGKNLKISLMEEDIVEIKGQIKDFVF